MRIFVFALLIVATPTVRAGKLSWPQFRGPGGSGLAEEAKPPIEFSATSNALWRISLPPGASSPCIWGDKIFLTGGTSNVLETLCLRRSDGEILWRQTVHVDRVEPVHHRDGSPAASTPVTDGKHLYVYFGSYGVLCYDLRGRQKWRHPLPMTETFGGFGSGSSPVLIDHLVILNRDQLTGSHLLALRKKNGQTAWRIERGESHSWSTPLLWQERGRKSIVLPTTVEVKGYDPKNGAQRWVVRGTGASTVASPAAGGGLVYVSSLSTPTTSFPTFAAQLEQMDASKDGALSYEETKGTRLEGFGPVMDYNKDKLVSREEYEHVVALMTSGRSGMVAIRPSGQGDITQTHVAWTHDKGLPYISSPIYYRGRVYMVRDGGMLTCLDAQTGQPLYLQERLGAEGSYYASLVAADGRIYAASLNGVVVVFEAGDTLNVLARNKLGERILATPAIVGDTLYVRTEKQLFAFRANNSPAADR